MSTKNHLTVKSIHQCFHLIYFLLYHSGSWGCKIKNEKELHYCKGYKLYGYTCRLIYLTGLIGGFIYKTHNEELYNAIVGHLSPVVKAILKFECVICPIIYMQVILYLNSNRDKYINLANTLQSLDEKMRNYFPGIKWNYYKTMQKYNTLTVGLYGFYTIVSTMYIFKIAHCMCGWISSAIIAVCYASVTGAPAFVGFLFIGNMDLLRLRFRLIRKLLRQLRVKLRDSPRNQNNNVSKFKLLENYFMEYSNLILPLNQTFSVIIFSGLFHDFAVLTSLGYLMCSKALDMNDKICDYLFICLFMIPRMYKVFNTAIYGYVTQKERANCFQEFIKIGYLFQKSYLPQHHVEAFLHWRLHNNYHVTVGKFLNCNLSLIFLMLNSIVNYILILIQLQFQQNDIANRLTDNLKFPKNG